MSLRCLHLPNRPRLRGLTLVEVVAGLALLASLLVGCLTAYGRQTHQVRQARLRLTAVQVADALLAQWFQNSDSIPVDAQGSFEGPRQLFWSTRLIPDEDATLLASQVLRLDIVAPLEQPDQVTILSVDILVPKRLPAEEEKTEKAEETKRTKIMKGKIDGAS